MPKDQRKERDVVAGFKFWVEIDGIQVAGFSECTGFSIETEIFEYAEGGWNYHTHKLPVRTKYSNITLKRGIDPGQDLHRWYVDSINGVKKGRKNTSIIIYRPNGEVAVTYALREAYPVKWTAPDLRTDSGSTAIEVLEIAHNGLTAMPQRK